MTYRAYREGRAFVLPASVAAEAALARSATILPARTLLDVCGHLCGRQPIEPYREKPQVAAPAYPDLAGLRGQLQARRALEIAAAGSHSILSLCPTGPQERSL